MTKVLTRLISAAVLALLSTSAQAATVDINGMLGNFAGSCGDGTNNSFVCFTSSLPNNDPETQIDTIEELFGLDPDSGLMHLYRSNVGGFDEGSFADIYQTTYANSPGDPSEASIEQNNPGDTITCPSCYLVVTDGNHEPYTYFYDISDWDGIMDLALTGFWPEGGAISHVAIYGVVSPIPVPAAFWLFGGALLGLIGIAKRRTV